MSSEKQFRSHHLQEVHSDHPTVGVVPSTVSLCTHLRAVSLPIYSAISLPLVTPSRILTVSCSALVSGAYHVTATCPGLQETCMLE